MRFFFKHERAVFTNGRFTFATRPSYLLLVFLALLFGFLVYLSYSNAKSRLSTSALVGLIALRSTSFALIIFLLLGPAIVVPSIVPRSSDIAILVDDSQSMLLADEAERRNRLDAVKAMLPVGGDFLRQLDGKFIVDLYGFSADTAKASDVNELTGEGTVTDFAQSLKSVMKSATGRPLSAVVVMSDGGHNVSGDLEEQLRELRSRNIPVYTVGVGSAVPLKDAELVRVNVPRRVLVGSSVNAEALVRLSDSEPKNVLLSVREDGRTVKTRAVQLRGNGETQLVRVVLTPANAGLHRYTFSLTPLDDELTLANNNAETLVEVAEGPVRVLYMEGEPRWELGKLRSSLSVREKNLQLVSLLRSGENKFYRQGVEEEGQLAKGFPATAEELFAYDGLILGSVEAAFFTNDQLKNIEAFVARRGGGLLALGGRSAFDGGKYASTVIADLLPLYLDGNAPQQQSVENSTPVFRAQLTAQGRDHPATRLDEDATLNQKKWDELPPLTIPEVLRGVKPGAAVLLGAARGDANGVPLLAEERYGRGRTMALTASDTWRWKMKLDVQNNIHETFWRQLLRYLVSAAPRQNEIATGRDVYAPNEKARIVAEVRDQKYEPIKNANVKAVITKPSGEKIEIPLKFNSQDAVEVFAGEFIPDEPGQHHVELKAEGASTELKTAAARSDFLVTELNRESYNAKLNADLLQHVAAETGGKYYPLAEAKSLVADLIYRDSPVSERVTKDLWDMPINFFLLIGLISAEWFLRKREGLA